MVPAERPSGNRAERTESERAAYHWRMRNLLRSPAAMLPALVLAACTGAGPSATAVVTDAAPSMTAAPTRDARGR